MWRLSKVEGSRREIVGIEMDENVCRVGNGAESNRLDSETGLAPVSSLGVVSVGISC